MRFTRSIVPAYVALLATLAAGGLGLRAAMRSLDVYLRKEPVPLRADLGSIPTALGRWQKLGDDQLMDAAMVESLGTDKYLTRTYALDGDASKGVMTCFFKPRFTSVQGTKVSSCTPPAGLGS